MSINRPDYWRVNSYGYPNPFSGEQRAKSAWQTLVSFHQFSSYSRLKEYWSSTDAPRTISPHAVESWKAAFEEFGLLYVLTGTDEIRITPAGCQFRDAADANRIREFAWIGLSLLLRYPLSGPRRPRNPRHAGSDLLLYWFFYAAIRELQNYLWRTELDRVLCKVFQLGEAQDAITQILRLRAGDRAVHTAPLPADPSRGAFYNSINQVIVHASMNHLLIAKSRDDSLYVDSGREQRMWVRREWLPLIDSAIGSDAVPRNCSDDSRFVARMPQAPDFSGDEQGYFEYLGARVDPIPAATAETRIPFASLSGGAVAVLSKGVHYALVEANKITGSIQHLCSLALRQRVIVSHDLDWSYVVEKKARTGPDEILVTIRRGRPITGIGSILPLLRRDNV